MFSIDTNFNANMLILFFLHLDTFAHYKRLQGGVYFVDSLPMTSTGKIARILVTGIAIGLYNKKNRCNNLKMNASSNFG